MNDLMPFDLNTEHSAIIKVIGVGGGGSNAVNHMYEQGITDVDFIITNTDQQALSKSNVPIKIHLGKTLTQGLGAGNKPERGKDAAIENIEDVKTALGDNTKMVFITAGMGGGTGTGAAPVIAQAAKELGILTVGIVTIPFRFEGKRRVDQAVKGVEEMSKHVDSLVVINNERVREIYGNLGIREAFAKADDVLTIAAKGIADIITKEGHVNVDFADVNTVMQDSGVAIMGSSQAEGEGRAMRAIEDALNSPLLNSNDITGAKNILINIAYGNSELTGDELYEITGYVQDAAGKDKDADIIWGYNQDENLGDTLSVTIIATGFKTDIIPELYIKEQQKEKVIVDTISNKVEDKVANAGGQTDKVGVKPGESIVLEGDKIIKTEQKSENIELKKPEPKNVPINDSDDDFDEQKRIEKALEKMSLMNKANKKRSNLKTTPIDYSKDNIEDLENIPAFKRRYGELNNDTNVSNKKDISRYKLDESDDEWDLSPNSFLHDNVD